MKRPNLSFPFIKGNQQNTIQIAPIVTTNTVTTTVSSFEVSCVSLNLFQSATFQVTTFDENKKIIGRQNVTLTPEEYQQWNNNDQYIINVVAEKLNFNLI